MKRVLYLLQSQGFFSGPNRVVGGHIAHIIGVVEAFQRLNYEVIILSFDTVPFWDHNAAGYRYFKPTRFPIGRQTVQQWQITNEIITAVKDTAPSLVYGRWEFNLFFNRIRRVQRSVPIVMECNTPLSMDLGVGQISPLDLWLRRKVDEGYAESSTLISAVSSEVKNFLMSGHPTLDPGKIIVNPNGVDATFFRPLETKVRRDYKIPHNALTIGYAGNFRRWHRVDLLIRAFQQLARDDVYLLIIGTGPGEVERMLHQAAQARRSSHIVFTGPVPYSRMPEFLSACDILVAPQSATFGGELHQSPVKLFEYMAVQRAVVGSRIGQIKEIIDEDRNGMLFEPDSVEDLQRILMKLLQNELLRQQLGQQARRDVMSMHSWEANVARILDALDSLGFNQPKSFGMG
jgi:glycosyltransferase involved in cell wall biosynthesis